MATVYSNVLPVTCDTVPISMTAPTLVEVNPSDITIKWDALTDSTANGGDVPDFYLVEWSPDNSNWEQVNTIGDGLYFQINHTVAFLFNTTT